MPDQIDTPDTHSEAESKPAAQERKPVQEERRSGNTLPLVLSAIAVVLAALALIAGQIDRRAEHINPMQAVNSKLGQIEARIGDVETQIRNDKMDVVEIQLKKMLLELKQLSAIADETTRTKLERAYQALKPLSSPATQVQAEVDAGSTTAGENQTVESSPEASEVTDSNLTDTAEPADEASPAGNAADETMPENASIPPAESPDTSITIPTGDAESSEPQAESFTHPSTLLPASPETAPDAQSEGGAVHTF
ncbi:MAG: hypothetical protein Q9M30_06340 [Mariprofundaceae bacterium]|nr:hypothetical protein [Mariprofundaceae bacterium]